MTQKFHKGDYVRVAKDLGPHMSHFTADCNAIVMGSYDDQYGRGDTSSYTIYIENRGETSWYKEGQLTLIEADRIDLLDEWKNQRKREVKERSNLDWIFANGEEVLKKPDGASVQALANCFGLTNLWGSNGEGMTYHMNAMKTLKAAAPYLKTGDKEAWLKACERVWE